MNVAETIRSKRVHIRPIAEPDAFIIFTHLQDPEIVKWTTRIPYPYSEADAEKFIADSRENWAKRLGFVFSICLNSDNAQAGVISLSNVTFKHSCGELGFWIAKSYWGRGIGTESVKCLLKFAFEGLDLYRVYASAFEANIASRRILEKCGFQNEGVMREAILRYDRRHNFFNYGILKSEYVSEGKV
jgi:RimJ/RimL family protein N-acetyltransferase